MREQPVAPAFKSCLMQERLAEVVLQGAVLSSTQAETQLCRQCEVKAVVAGETAGRVVVGSR